MFGGGTVSVLQKFKIRVGVSDDDEVSHGRRGLDAAAAQKQKSCLARSWQGFDTKYIKPVLSAAPSPGVDSWAAIMRTITQYVVASLSYHVDMSALL